MFAGILFTAFYRCLKKRYLYSLTFVVITFLFIEINTGLKPFSMTLLSLFIYIFILPKDESQTSYNSSSAYLYIIFFYIGLVIMWSILFGIHPHLIATLIINVEKANKTTEIKNIKKQEIVFFLFKVLLGVPSGKCGFTTLRNFPDFLI
jgi:hypothetical protein